MSKTGEAYIRLLNAEEDARLERMKKNPTPPNEKATMNADKIVRRGLIAAIALAGLAAWMIYTVERQSKRESEWRNRTTPFFQNNFPPKGGAK